MKKKRQSASAQTSLVERLLARRPKPVSAQKRKALADRVVKVVEEALRAAADSRSGARGKSRRRRK